jgi:hypothetical protein
MNSAAELGLILVQALVILAADRRPQVMLIILLGGTAAAIATALGLPKAGYHFLLLCLFAAAVMSRPLDGLSQSTLRLCLFAATAIAFVGMTADSGLTLAGKYETHAPIYLLLMLGFLIGPEKLNRWFVFLMIAIAAVAAHANAARGVLLGAVFMGMAVFFAWTARKWLITAVMVGFMAFYFTAYPVMTALGYTDILSGSASNYQRAGMNLQALIDMAPHPITFDDQTIFAAASTYRYSYNAADLTVHSLPLAFGLFNGWMAAVLLIALMIVAARRLTSGPYYPFFVYLFFEVVLGPDSFSTRCSLLLISGLVLLHRSRPQEGWHPLPQGYAPERGISTEAAG